MSDVINQLRAFKLTHTECDDPFYSCPKSQGGCSDDNAGDDCTCGADAFNAQLEALTTSLETQLSQAQAREEAAGRWMYERAWIDVERADEEDTNETMENEAWTEYLSQRGEIPVTCKWRIEDADTGLWVGSCGAAWQFTDGGPVEHEMDHCPKCGHSVEVVK